MYANTRLTSAITTENMPMGLQCCGVLSTCKLKTGCIKDIDIAPDSHITDTCSAKWFQGTVVVHRVKPLGASERENYVQTYEQL